MRLFTQAKSRTVQVEHNLQHIWPSLRQAAFKSALAGTGLGKRRVVARLVPGLEAVDAQLVFALEFPLSQPFNSKSLRIAAGPTRTSNSIGCMRSTPPSLARPYDGRVPPANDRLHTGEGVLGALLAPIARLLLAPSPSDLADPSGRPVAFRQVRLPLGRCSGHSRWGHNNLGSSRLGRLVDRGRTAGSAGYEATNLATYGLEEFDSVTSVVRTPAGQRLGDDPAGSLRPRGEFPPAAPAFPTVFGNSPLSLPHDRETGAVHDPLNRPSTS